MFFISRRFGRVPPVRGHGLREKKAQTQRARIVDLSNCRALHPLSGSVTVSVLVLQGAWGILGPVFIGPYSP